MNFSYKILSMVDANVEEMIFDKYFRKVLLQFQIVDIQDTLNIVMTTFT